MTHSLPPKSRWINFKNKVEVPLEWETLLQRLRKAFTILFAALVQIKPHQKSIHAEVALHGVIVINKFLGKDESLSAIVKLPAGRKGRKNIEYLPKIMRSASRDSLGARGEGRLRKLFPKSTKFSSCSAPFIPSRWMMSEKAKLVVKGGYRCVFCGLLLFFSPLPQDYTKKLNVLRQRKLLRGE